MRAAPAELELRRAALEEILGVRHAVLRPSLPFDTARFAGDDEPGTRHFGVFVPDAPDAVACVTAMRRALDGRHAWQLRGMATRTDLAGRGLGRALLGFAEDSLRREGGPSLLWCNARVSALGFWQKTGWKILSEPFDIPGVGPHRVLERRLDC